MKITYRTYKVEAEDDADTIVGKAVYEAMHEAETRKREMNEQRDHIDAQLALFRPYLSTIAHLDVTINLPLPYGTALNVHLGKTTGIKDLAPMFDAMVADGWEAVSTNDDTKSGTRDFTFHRDGKQLLVWVWLRDSAKCRLVKIGEETETIVKPIYRVECDEEAA